MIQKSELLIGGTSRALGYGVVWLLSTVLGAARITRGNKEVNKRGNKPGT